jgi:serine protease Do
MFAAASLLVAVLGPLPLPSCQDPAHQPTTTPPPAAPLAADFAVRTAKVVFPSVVTVRAYRRRASEAPATPAAAQTATPPSATASDPAPTGWLLNPTRDDYPGFTLLRAGSGFLVGREGEGDVLTNLDIVEDAPDTVADLVEVETQDGSRILCDVLGCEPTLNLAMLRAAVFPNWSRPALPPVVWGDSDAAEPGQLLLACGDPIGPEKFLASGLLAAKPARDCYQELLSAAYLQLSLVVPTPALGGPLADLDGRVLGLTCRLRLEEGAEVSPGLAQRCTFALPSKIAQGIYESIREARSVRSPWFGFAVMSRTEIAAVRGAEAFQKLAKPRSGILVENVFAPSPAAAAGVLPGDFLVQFGAVEIHAPVDFQRQMYLTGIGRTAKLTFWRQGERFEREIEVAERPAAAKPR